MTSAGAPGDTGRERHVVRNGTIVATVVLVIIAVPLAWHAVENARTWWRETTGAPHVRAWLGERALEVRTWSMEGDVVRLLLVGPDVPPDPQVLATDLAEAFGGPVTVDVEHVRTVRERAEATP